MGAPKAGLLEPAPRRFGEAVAHEVVVDGDGACLQAAGEGGGPLAVAAPHGGREAQVRVVGQSHRLLHVADLHHTYHGAEGLLLHGDHVVGDPGEDHGGQEEPLAALGNLRLGEDRGALGQGVFNMPLHGLHLALSGHAPHVRPEGAARPHSQRFNPGFESRQEGLVGLLVHIDALHAPAGLARVLHARPQRARGGPLHIGILADQHGVVSAQLQGNGREGLGGLGHEHLAHGDAAGEEELVHARFQEGVARHPARQVDEREEALGEARGAHHRFQRAPHHLGLRGGLEDDRVDRQQGHHHLVEGDAEGVVPGRDDPHHAPGETGHGGTLVGQGHSCRTQFSRSEKPGGHAGVVGHRDGRGKHLRGEGVQARLAVVQGNHLGEVVCVVHQVVPQGKHPPRPLPRRQRAPGGLDLPRPGHGGLEFRNRVEGRVPKHFTRGGVDARRRIRGLWAHAHLSKEWPTPLCTVSPHIGYPPAL